MAAVTTLPIARKRKQITYGRSARSANAWQHMTAEDREEGNSKVAGVRESRPLHDKAKASTITSTATSPAKGHVKMRAKQHCSWDIPSDDELGYASKPRTGRGAVFSSASSTVPPPTSKPTEVHLAPWEKAKSDAGRPGQTPEKDEILPAQESQLEVTTAEMPVLSKPVSSKARSSASAKDARARALPGSMVHVVPRHSGTSSAKARLQARKGEPRGTVTSTAKPAATKAQVMKRQVAATQDEQSSYNNQKRQRIDRIAPKGPIAIHVHDPELFAPDELTRSATPMVDDFDVFDFPDADHPDLSVPNHGNNLRHTSVKQGKTSPKSRAPIPVQVSNMVHKEIDIDNSRDNTMNRSRDRSTTPVSITTSRINPSTPPKDSGSGVGRAITSSGTVTPKQAEIWNRLLSNDAHLSSPDVPSIGKLQIQSIRGPRVHLANSAPPPRLATDTSQGGARRPKLVDMLKASAQGSDDGSDDELSDASDIETVQVSACVADPASEFVSQTNPSQSQTALPPTRGVPKITYARSRSHLQDTFENDLLLSVPSAPFEPKKPTSAAVKNANSALHRSPQNFDDSDDEDDTRTKGFQSIYELRAGGSNARFMNDITTLLEDISDHKISARSRRRSALMELTLRLTEKEFAQRFCRQGFERQLVSQCSASSDIVTSLALASAFMMLLAGDLSDPAVLSLDHENLLKWLSRLLVDRRDVRTIAKDRSSNMSKSAQTSFSEFSAKLADSDLWAIPKPTTVTPRIISLKAIELLVQRLRRDSNSAELFDFDLIKPTLPLPTEVSMMYNDHVVTADMATTISTLESLALPAFSSSWTPAMLEVIASMLTSPVLIQHDARHIYFLLLRLCTTITNETPQNCEIFSTTAVLSHLLVAIRDGFDCKTTVEDEERNALDRDVRVLEVGLLIALTERSAKANAHAATIGDGTILSDLTRKFCKGQKHADEAETVEAVEANVSHAYLAVALANICQDTAARDVVAANLPGHSLNVLVAAVEEFVTYHQEVDRSSQSFVDEEGGAEVWSTFTELLKGVLTRLKTIAMSR